MIQNIITTKDGSHTIQLENKAITYHSINGAIQETNHIFIDAGFKYCIDKKLSKINILEVGFGTGLNALITLLNAAQKHIFYNTIEPFPLGMEIVNQLNYGYLLHQQDLFISLHNQPFNNEVLAVGNFKFLKSKCFLQDFETDKQFNLVYFDAFAPTDQPELWTEDIFFKIYNLMLPNAVLVTYCCKGVVIRTLKKVGFSVEKLQGPPGKREMIRAIKSN